MSVALTLLGISLLVVLHEAGHFLVARACSMRVLRFSIGFGPTLLARQVGATTYQLAAIPLGGYVEMAAGEAAGSGEGKPSASSNEASAGRKSDKAAPVAATVATADTVTAGKLTAAAATTACNTAADVPATTVGAVATGAAAAAQLYSDSPLWQRALVIAAGPAANWLITLALLTTLAATTGLTTYDEASGQLGALTPQGAAAAAGLREGDQIIRIDDHAVEGFASIVSAVRSSPGKPLTFAIARAGAPLTLTVTPAGRSGGTGSIGALPPASRQRVAPVAAVAAGIRATWAMTTAQARMLADVVSGRGGGQLSGLPGIVRTVSRQAEEGFGRLAESLAWLSIGLCLLNLAPIPALDGSRLLLLGLEAVRRQPLSERVEGWVHSVGFAVLLAVMAVVSVRDLL